MAKSLQDILRRRQQEEFVGREEQLAFFQANLGYAPEDPRRRFVVNVYGQGGVGKTWLLRRFRQIVDQTGAVVAYTDEAEDSVPGVMGRIAQQFNEQGHPLKAFAERYKVYRQRKEEIEADPEAPQGFPAFLGRTLARGGLSLARRVPVGGVVADFVDEDAFASLAGDFATYVARKISNKDEVHLVLEPVEVLTPLLLADLRGAEEYLQALFFDSYERTGGFLDPWLRDLLEGRHGDVPANVVLVIAGRDELDRNLWSSFEGVLTHLSLEPFTEVEAHDYLIRKGIHNEQVVKVILHLSGRLPLLVATLAAESPEDPAEVGDPSGEAVERFLKWVEDPNRRQVALDAGMPRRLNQDVLAVLVGKEQANELFAWLKGMPFTEKRGDGWVYHDVVREQMLHYKQQESPGGWTDLHGRLAQYYEGLRDDLGLEEEAGRRERTWQVHALEALYHRLCEAPQIQLATALNGFARAWKAQRAFAHSWVRAIEDAGKDIKHPSLQQWGKRLILGMEAVTEYRDEGVIEMSTALLGYPQLEKLGQSLALRLRGGAYLATGRYREALADLDQAVEVDPDYATVFALRGLAYTLTGYPEKAFADLSRAMELDSNLSTVALCLRALTYMSMGRFKEASADIDLAIRLKSSYLEDLSMWMGDGQESAHLLEDYDRSLVYLDHLAQLISSLQESQTVGKIAPMNAQSPALLLQFAQLTQNAMSTLTPEAVQRSLGLWQQMAKQLAFNMGQDTDVAQVMMELLQASKGLTPEDVIGLLQSYVAAAEAAMYYSSRQYEQALSACSSAIKIAPSGPLASRLILFHSKIHEEMKHYEEALADLDRAVALDETLINTLCNRRGLLLCRLERYGEAIESYKLGLKTNPNDCTLLYNTAVAMARWKGLANAQTQIDAARASLLALAETQARGVALYGLGGLEALEGKAEQALEYLEKAISLDREAVDWAYSDVAWLDLRADPHFQSLISETLQETKQ